jgi:hypothetical protein
VPSIKFAPVKNSLLIASPAISFGPLAARAPLTERADHLAYGNSIFFIG